MASAAVQPCPDCGDCPQAKANLRELQQHKLDSEVADAAYKRPPPDVIAPPEPQIVPPDPIRPMTHVSDPKELDDIGLSPDDLSIDGTNFGAVVYKTGAPPTYTVSFRGTEAGSDWRANIDQGRGKDTAYYARAQQIARDMEVKQLSKGAPKATTRFVGHSLGGGLASAAAVAVDGDATTFNAAGLHENTIARGGNRTGGNVTMVRVKGELLTTGQENLPAPRAHGDKAVSLDPPFHLARDMLAQIGAGAMFGLKGVAAAELARAYFLHGMDNVKASLDLAIENARGEVQQRCGGSGSW